MCRRTDWTTGCASADVVIPNVGIEHALRRMLGETPGQDVRSATEAAGAANVVDGAPPGERGQRSKGWTTHRTERVPKNRHQCCDQVAERKKPGANPASFSPPAP